MMLISLLHSSPLQAYLWISILIAEALALYAFYRGGAKADYPWFGATFWFSLVKTITLMSLPPGNDHGIYAWVSYPGAIVQGVVMAMAIAELYGRTLGPKADLWEWVPRETATILAIAICVSAVLTVCFYPRYGGHALRVIMSIQEGEIWVLALGLMGLIGYTAILAIPWWPRDAHIAAGFVVMICVNAATLTLMLHGPKRIVYPAGRTGQIAVLVAFVGWSWKLWRKTGCPAKTSWATIGAALEQHRETAADFETFEGPGNEVIEKVK